MARSNMFPANWLERLCNVCKRYNQSALKIMKVTYPKRLNKPHWVNQSDFPRVSQRGFNSKEGSSKLYGKDSKPT